MYFEGTKKFLSHLEEWAGRTYKLLGKADGLTSTKTSAHEKGSPEVRSSVYNCEVGHAENFF